jgi:Na+-driven multidrug efflux pump
MLVWSALFAGSILAAVLVYIVGCSEKWVLAAMGTKP